MPTNVNPETRERLVDKYAKRYAYENCQTIGTIFKPTRKEKIINVLKPLTKEEQLEIINKVKGTELWPLTASRPS